MSKINLAGLLFCAAGVVMAIFQAIESMMTAGEIQWKQIALVDMFDPEQFVWIDNLSSAFLRNALDTFVSWPAFGILIGIGVIFLIIGGLTRK
ncbi:MAG: hypothetical protein JEZ11_06490 [Desulfobacterales bacterium]|nr:hypothetical protein [Desulfobacterales bacterium]